MRVCVFEQIADETMFCFLNNALRNCDFMIIFLIWLRLSSGIYKK